MKKLFLCLLLVVVSSAQALLVDNLYQADTLVANQSKPEWEQALPKILAQVFVKVSGNPNVISNEQIRKNLQQAGNLVQSYSYSNSNNATLLHVEFNNQSVDQMLHAAGQPIWGKDRPLTLVWLAVETPEGQTLVPNNPTYPLVLALQNNVNKRGLPILWPSMDLEDITHLSVSEVWNLTEPTITQSSQRYKTENILAGKVFRTPQNKWQGQWLFIHGNQAAHWTTEGNDANEAVAAVVTQLANATVGQAIDRMPQDSQVMLKVTGIKNLDDYAQMLKYMHSLGSVVKAEANQIEADSVLLAMVVDGGQSALEKDISLSQKILPVANPNNPVELIYHWNVADSTLPNPPAVNNSPEAAVVMANTSINTSEIAADDDDDDDDEWN